MTTSLSTNYPETRDSISTRALRIVGAIGQGEVPTTTQLSEAAQAFNHIVKKFQTDGMHLWKKTTSFFTPVASTGSYIIGVGYTLSQAPPLKMLQVWARKTSTGADTPMILITKEEYDRYSNKSTTGTPNMVFYDPPGVVSTGGEKFGTIYVLPTPDATFAAGNKIYFTGSFELYDLDAASDNVDFPSYYYNALVWAVARELSYEYGLPFAERSMIAKTAQEEHVIAMSYDNEEGSVYFQPWGY